RKGPVAPAESASGPSPAAPPRAIREPETDGSTTKEPAATDSQPGDEDMKEGTVEGTAPQVRGSGIAPLREAPREKADRLDVEFDLDGRKDGPNEKDSKLRDLGWKAYGKRLASRNRDKKKE
ncbi:MAG TPA: hypothetical protein VLA34_09900, partial [Candidatus Krumholzibacterium sp.]|nr:hypothetical protein [Candidatus Krumholzibacterium sp.]